MLPEIHDKGKIGRLIFAFGHLKSKMDCLVVWWAVGGDG